MNQRITVLACMLAIAIIFINSWQAIAQEKGKGEAPKGKPLPVVAVQKAAVAPLSRTLELTGSATPTRQARLADRKSVV